MHKFFLPLVLLTLSVSTAALAQQPGRGRADPAAGAGDGDDLAVDAGHDAPLGRAKRTGVRISSDGTGQVSGRPIRG